MIIEDPNEDTEWNDALRAKGIIPPKKEKEITEDQIVSMLEQTIEEKTTCIVHSYFKYRMVYIDCFSW
jgi:hypothetical protein